MTQVNIPRYRRRINGKWRNVKGYSRKKRPRGKKKYISKKFIRLYPVRDEFGRHKGWSRKPGR